MLWTKGIAVCGAAEQKTEVQATASSEVGVLVLKLGKGPENLLQSPMVAAAVALKKFGLLSKQNSVVVAAVAAAAEESESGPAQTTKI
jgi:hypothetical protein